MTAVLGPFNIVDLILIALAVLAAWSGWRQGLIGGVMSFVGFVAGAIAGVLLAPHVLMWVGVTGVVGLAITVVVALALAALVSSLLVAVARLARRKLVWRPLRAFDSAGGAVFAVASLAVIAWLLASALVVLPNAGLVSEVRSSRVLGAIDDTVPQQARTWVSDLGRMLDNTGGLPRAFAGIGVEPIVPVAAPDPALLGDPAVRRAWGSLVKVEGQAPGCGTQVDGSGFVFAPDRVMTNAHVVAGTDDLKVLVRGVGASYQATVVYFDPVVDVAVLDVPGLDVPPLDFASAAASSGASAVVAGFPGGGPLQAGTARVRAELTARGKDIYGQGDAWRDVYSLRATVRPGNSGGPLLRPDGTVYGVVFAAAIDDPETGYALTAGQVADAATAGHDATAAVAVGSCHTR
ncbi:MAG: MarP family serine protease [Candidatus Nanopelagicales bacterium]